ncbi:MAG: class I SAM-dependent methyltransferase [Deltaproteobacteria bacterium]|nr:class I SAM-dependent methyltransferase [Deltaproteobacteria bacterium]
MLKRSKLFFDHASDDSIRNPKPLAVVAHWDDEIISVWGVMAVLGADVLCVTDKHAPDYRDIFNRVVEHCGGTPMNWDIPLWSENGKFVQLDTPDNVSRLVRLFRQNKFDILFTHHFNGDMGCHKHHLMLPSLCYKAALELKKEMNIRLFCFGSGHKPPFLPEQFWFGKRKKIIPITGKSKMDRLHFALKYKPDFDKKYPIILQDHELQYEVPVKSLFHLILLRLKFNSLIKARRSLGNLTRILSKPFNAINTKYVDKAFMKNVMKLVTQNAFGKFIFYKFIKHLFFITPLRRKSNAYLRNLLKDKYFDTVLNLGCGKDDDYEGGRYSDYINCRKVIKIDINPDMPDLDFVAQADNLPLEDNSVDFLFMNWAFQYAHDPKTVKELLRVLQPRAFALISYTTVDDHVLAEISAELTPYFDICDSFRMKYRPQKGNAELWGEILFLKLKE